MLPVFYVGEKSGHLYCGGEHRPRVLRDRGAEEMEGVTGALRQLHNGPFASFIPHNMLSGSQTKQDEVADACGTHGDYKCI
jgi:hypothetical protein